MSNRIMIIFQKRIKIQTITLYCKKLVMILDSIRRTILFPIQLKKHLLEMPKKEMFLLALILILREQC